MTSKQSNGDHTTPLHSYFIAIVVHNKTEPLPAAGDGDADLFPDPQRSGNFPVLALSLVFHRSGPHAPDQIRGDTRSDPNTIPPDDPGWRGCSDGCGMDVHSSPIRGGGG